MRLVLLLILLAVASAETSTVCKCDGKKCGEVKILSSLVPLAVKLAGLKEGNCVKYGYTEPTGEILKVKTPVGTIESPVFVKKTASDIKKNVKRISSKYIRKIRESSKARRKLIRPVPAAPVYDSPIGGGKGYTAGSRRKESVPQLMRKTVVAHPTTTHFYQF